MGPKIIVEDNGEPWSQKGWKLGQWFCCQNPWYFSVGSAIQHFEIRYSVL